MPSYYGTQTEAEFLEHLRSEVLPYEEKGREDERFSSIWETKPTPLQIEDWILKHWIMPQKIKEQRERKKLLEMMKESNPEMIDTRIITLQFDKKNHEELTNPDIFTKAFCEIYVNEFKKSQYKFITNGKVSFEFYTENGFNPHFHIYTEDNTQVGKIAQVLRRKFVDKDKWKIWNIDVKKGTSKNQEQYIEGTKKRKN